MALIASDGAGGYVEESLGEPDADVTLPATVMAGDRVLMALLARDSAPPWRRTLALRPEDERLAVSARAPAEAGYDLDTVDKGRSPRRSPPRGRTLSRRSWATPPPRDGPACYRLWRGRATRTAASRRRDLGVAGDERFCC